MGKAKTKTKEKTTPYSRKKEKKPITKSEKIKNASITEDLDNLMGDLQEQLTSKKKKIQIKNDTMEDSSKLEEEQRLYEKTQNDMDDALGLLTKL